MSSVPNKIRRIAGLCQNRSPALRGQLVRLYAGERGGSVSVHLNNSENKKFRRAGYLTLGGTVRKTEYQKHHRRG